jgi:hypothetical protein
MDTFAVLAGGVFFFGKCGSGFVIAGNFLSTQRLDFTAELFDLQNKINAEVRVKRAARPTYPPMLQLGNI